MKTILCQDTAAYEAFLNSSPHGHFMQTPQWAAVKEDWKPHFILAQNDAGEFTGAICLLVRKVPGLPYTLMMSSRGPMCDPDDHETLDALLDAAKALAKKCRTYLIMLEPDVRSDNLPFENHMNEQGFVVHSKSKNFEGINPRFVYRLDIAGYTEEELLAHFHQKTRYNIRLAARKGVTVRVGTKADLPAWHKIMVETGMRDSFVTRDVSYFERMYDQLGEAFRLYLAEYDGEIIAGNIMILKAKKCWYLYGATSNRHRNTMPAYLLQWEAMRWALAEGCTMYDFRGVSGDLDESNPLYGIYRFKKGFNGELVELIGQMDYVAKPFINWAVDRGFKLMRKVRKMRYLKKHRQDAPPAKEE